MEPPFQFSLYSFSCPVRAFGQKTKSNHSMQCSGVRSLSLYSCFFFFGSLWRFIWESKGRWSYLTPISLVLHKLGQKLLWENEEWFNISKSFAFCTFGAGLGVFEAYGLNWTFTAGSPPPPHFLNQIWRALLHSVLPQTNFNVSQFYTHKLGDFYKQPLVCDVTDYPSLNIWC